jgi:hypothetical protein
MDILLLMLLVWAYNEQPKDVKEEQPEIVPVVEVEVPDNAVNVTTVTQTAAALTAVGEAMTGTSTATNTSTETSTETTSVTSTEQAIIDELNTMTETTTVVPTTSTTTSSSTSTSSTTST